jgi:hypothetical protein
MDINRFEDFIGNLHNNINKDSKLVITLRLMTSVTDHNGLNGKYKTSSDNKCYNNRDLNYGYNKQAFSELLNKYNYSYELVDTSNYYEPHILDDLKIVIITPL